MFSRGHRIGHGPERIIPPRGDSSKDPYSAMDLPLRLLCSPALIREFAAATMPEAVKLVAGLDDMAVVRQAVQQRRGHTRSWGVWHLTAVQRRRNVHCRGQLNRLVKSFVIMLASSI